MITELTQDKIDKFPEYVDKWTKIGLCTEPANRVEAEKAINLSYQLAGLSPPKKIIWSGSPFGQAIIRAIMLDDDIRNKVIALIGNSIKNYIKNSPVAGELVSDSLRASVTASSWHSVEESVMVSVRTSVARWIRDSVGDSVAASVRASVGDSVTDSVRDWVTDLVRNSVWDSVGNTVGNLVWHSVMNSVRDSVRDLAWDSVGDSIWHSVRESFWDLVMDSVTASIGDSVINSVRDSIMDPVTTSIGDLVRNSVGDSVEESESDSIENSSWDSIWDCIKESVKQSVWHSGYGQYDANWLGFCEYFRNELNLKTQTEKITGLIELANHAGWYIPHENICFVSERHCLLNRDENGHLHSLTEPACMYPDGWSIYAVHGVRVPEYVIKQPDKITIKNIENESNVEIRRVMIDQYDRKSKGRYLKDCGAVLIDCDIDQYGHSIELYKKELIDDEPIIMVKLWNSTSEPDGSRKEYFLRVPPDISKAKEAQAWTFGETSSDYNPIKET